MASYLAFTKPYIQQLIELGYSDVMAQADEVRDFLQPEVAVPGAPQRQAAGN
jgi:hypothetical protein